MSGIRPGETVAEFLQREHDEKDYRRALYTNTKPDHPENWRTGGPCRCEQGDDSWTRDGVAMRVQWPERLRRQPAAERPRGRGRSR